MSKSKVFDFPNTNEEEDFIKTQIDNFEVWDWVEIKFHGLTEAQTVASIAHYDLYLEAGIQESEDGRSSLACYEVND